jgi:TolB-like protein/Flp pilus assembly protein TadD
MEQDETGTLARLKAVRTEVFDPETMRFDGRIFKNTGDGALAEFGSAVDAVQCAVEIQRALARRNADLPEDARIVLRIGISLGDVIVEGDDLYGTGVNVAARMEGLAEPGAICVSGNVFEHIGNALNVTFEDLGEQAVKNLDRLVRSYRVLLEPAAAKSEVREREIPPPPADQPSIAVLPFENLSNDPDQVYFADGIAEDIITALSRFSQFKVIARNSTFVYKGRNVDIREVARDLGVQYVLEGSVRKVGNRLRITGQLIEAAAGSHLWADRFDGDLEDVFELQDRITEAVIGAIEPSIMTAEIERARRQPPENLAAYDLFLHALPCLYSFRPDENARGLDFLHQAIDKDPKYALALAYCAWGYEQRLTRGWDSHGDADAETAIDFARRALATNSRDPRVLAPAGFVLAMVARDYDRGLSAIRRAEELNPNIPLVSMHIGGALLFGGGEPDRALPHLEHAIRVSPGDPGAYIYYAVAAMCHFFSGRTQEAVELARRSADIYPDWDTTYWVLVPALVELGLMDEARSALAKFCELSPHANAALLLQILPFRDKNMLSKMVDGLVAAGLPE